MFNFNTSTFLLYLCGLASGFCLGMAYYRGKIMNSDMRNALDNINDLTEKQRSHILQSLHDHLSKNSSPLDKLFRSNKTK